MLLTLVGVIFIMALVRYGAFLLSNCVAGRLDEIRLDAGGLGLPLLRGACSAVAADFVAIGSGLDALLPKADRLDSKTPILMVHGLYHNPTAWFLLCRRLRRAGFVDLHTFGYNSFTKDFDHALARMEERVDQLLGQAPDRKVVLIGHSLGGLICRCVAANPRFAGRVAGLITLGSPHGGSELAWIGPNRMARDLIPGRCIPKTVAETADPDCPKLGMYTLTDDYVFPLDMLRTGRPGWDEVACGPMGHVWMLYSTEVAGHVIDFLTRNGSRG